MLDGGGRDAERASVAGGVGFSFGKYGGRCGVDAASRRLEGVRSGALWGVLLRTLGVGVGNAGVAESVAFVGAWCVVGDPDNDGVTVEERQARAGAAAGGVRHTAVRR